jgi:hypothetical protein
MENETAEKMLKFLMKEGGHLKIVTGERSDVPDGELVARHGNPLADPAAWVVKDVVKLEGPRADGLMVAYSEDKDMTIGFPAALLRRLTDGAR